MKIKIYKDSCCEQDCTAEPTGVLFLTTTATAESALRFGGNPFTGIYACCDVHRKEVEGYCKGFGSVRIWKRFYKEGKNRFRVLEGSDFF